MSLPNYLAKIKSAGMYRFTFDKSQLPAADAETMRLVVGYSEKGPFNNPVYIDNKQDFINLFGNINKRLEKKGVYFHRMALQALSAGPILALNLKPFNDSGNDNSNEHVQYASFYPCDMALDAFDTPTMTVLQLFDTDRFWKLDADLLPSKISSNKYVNIAATDTKEMSCSFFFRKCHKSTVKQYNTTFRDWYKNLGEVVPEILEAYIDENMQDFFAEVYVFRGEFTPELTSGDGVLSRYFSTDGSLLTTYKNSYDEPCDALNALAADENSNFIGVYRGILLPEFKDQLGVYISLDIVFNKDKENHKMIMKLDDSLLEQVLTKVNADGDEDYENGHSQVSHWPSPVNGGWQTGSGKDHLNAALKPTYLEGYTYGTIQRNDTALNTCAASLEVLKLKGIQTALTNHVDSEYHYIVDTYAGMVIPSDLQATAARYKNAKFNISTIAKEKDNCLAIMNAPAKNDFIKTISNFSLDAFDKGDYKTYNFDLPSEVEGASHCAYYTPLVFGDGSVKTVVPSAALVSNNFMEKWRSRQPYYIVAGPNYGRMEFNGLIGPDYNYSREDLDVYEPMGINCMVYVPRKGTYINSNQTAKQSPVTALSKVHVRELVTYVQNEIEKMMQNYQWELNTQTLRDTIKTKADAILEKIKNNGGVYDYLNVCDGSNNTTEVIDNEMIILDTSIEPARGAGKMVQRLTIHKTGGISSLIK